MDYKKLHSNTEQNSSPGLSTSRKAVKRNVSAKDTKIIKSFVHLVQLTVTLSLLHMGTDFFTSTQSSDIHLAIRIEISVKCLTYPQVFNRQWSIQQAMEDDESWEFMFDRRFKKN